MQIKIFNSQRTELETAGILEYDLSEIPTIDIMKRKNAKKEEYFMANLKIELRLEGGKLSAILLGSNSEICRTTLQY
jgi:hypothetical protein